MGKGTRNKKLKIGWAFQQQTLTKNTMHKIHQNNKKLAKNGPVLYILDKAKK
jgi:hypothetical protein